LYTIIEEAENKFAQNIDELDDGKGYKGEALKKRLIKDIAKGRGEALGLDPNKASERKIIMN